VICPRLSPPALYALLGALVTMPGSAAARDPVAPTATELNLARRWAREQFGPPVPAAGVPVAREEARAELVVHHNHGPVQPNARGGEKLRIGQREFARGLYCHAPSRVEVRVPSPGARLTASIGVDTRANGGTVVFGVRVGERNLFRSGVLRGGEEPVSVSVDLKGATTFDLVVEDAGDGISCDQANWADARVELEDGASLWLGDLPIADDRPRPRSGTRPPFSFTLGGRHSDELLPAWNRSVVRRRLDEGRTETVQTTTDPVSGVEVRCTVIEYERFPTVEWTLHIRNGGATDSPVIEQVLPLDVTLPRSGADEFLLHRFRGSICADNDYEPIEERIGPGRTLRLATEGGRPTSTELPYFNVETGGQGGVLLVIGWPGQWSAHFLHQADGTLRVTGGQEAVRFRLRPGEEVRTPIAVAQLYRGDWLRAQNVWRRWMVAHNLPRPNGQPMRPQISVCNGNHFPGLMTNAADEIRFFERYLAAGIRPEWWWQDAGWYPCDGVGWPKVGTWKVDPVRFPSGIRQVSDWLKGHGIGTIVWFEPERVHAGTEIADEHPEWVHGGKAGGLLRLDDAACRAWITDRVDSLLKSEGIGFYRQDFNIDPLSYWRAADPPDRQGITEIRHVEGYLAFWDELVRRNPGLRIDSCASGGRRNDLETLRRAVPLLRSDYTFEPVGEQNHTYGLSFWMPFNGTGFIEIDPYLVRSLMAPELTLGCDMRRTDLDLALLKRLTEEWRAIADCFLGDYWPLTPYSRGQDVWMAWQFDLPAVGRGVVQAFRRAMCREAAVSLRLRGLEPAATYELRDFDGGPVRRARGGELMRKGLRVELPSPRSAATIAYRRVGG